MRVIAVAVGFDNLAVRQPGDEFEMPDGSSAPWFKPAADDAKGPKTKSKGKAQAESDEPGDTIA